MFSSAVKTNANSLWRVQVIGCLCSPFFLGNLSWNPALCGNPCPYLKNSNNHLLLYFLPFFCLERLPRKGPLENWAKAARIKQRWISFPASSHILLGSSLVLWAFFFISTAKNISFTKTFREKGTALKTIATDSTAMKLSLKKVGEQALFYFLKPLCKK